LELPWITELKDFVQMIGVPGVVSILVLVLMIIIVSTIFVVVSKQSSNNNKNLAIRLDQLATRLDQLSTTIVFLTEKITGKLPVDQSIIFFRAVMTEHIWEKLEFLKCILKRNNIEERREQIEINIARKFKSITTNEAEKLNKCKSVCGNMGDILQDEINWNKFLNAVYSIFFSVDESHKKIEDIRMLMDGYVDAIARVVEERGIHND